MNDRLIEALDKAVSAATEPSLKMSLRTGEVVGYDAGVLVLGFNTNFHRNKVRAFRNKLLYLLDELVPVHQIVCLKLKDNG